MHNGIRRGENAFHLVEHHTLINDASVFIQFVVPALLEKYLRVGINCRVQYCIHIYPQ